MRPIRVAAGALAALALPLPTRAIVVFRDPGRNLAPPAGALAGSGWQYSGRFGQFTGTAIGPHHFLTAKHVGGWFLHTFELGGKRYRVIARHDLSGCDLSVCQVAGTFPTWALIYRGGDEFGRLAVTFGRGRARGAPVEVGGRLRGWRWGPADHRLSWGTNRVGGILSEPGQGDLLVFDFRQGEGLDEGTLTTGDSGGGVFLQDAGDWALIGVNHAVDPPWGLRADDRGFPAALFDGRGLWRKEKGRPLQMEGDDAVTGIWFAVRLYPHRERILAIVNGPLAPDWLPPAAAGALLLAVAAGWGIARRRRRPRLPENAAQVALALGLDQRQ